MQKLNTQDLAWWLKPKDKVHETTIPYVKSLEQDQAARRLQMIQFARLYQNQDPGVYYTSLNSSNALTASTSRWSSRNVIKSAIDTATSKIGKSRPRPVMQTEGGNSALQKKAKGLTQFLDGQFDQMDLYNKSASIFRDSCIFGLGCLKFTLDSDLGTVDCERVLPDELIVDDADAIYGTPQQIHHRKYMSRAALIKKFPEFEVQILQAGSAFTDLSMRVSGVDLIRVVESWKLRSSPSSNDGRVSLCIDTATLRTDEWDKDYFPFKVFRWCDRIAGFFGLGIAEELYGTQLEINKLLRNIQLAQHLIAVPRVFMQSGTNVTSKIDNTIGAVVKYTGAAPIFNTAQAMNNEIYQHLKWLVQSAFDQVGISQLSANSMKPAGLDSGIALREYQDIESERFYIVGQKWERFHLDCATVVIDLMRDLMLMGKSPTVKIQDKDFLKTIDWKSVNLPNDKFILRMFAASILPTTPAAKLAKVQELMQSGLIPQEEGMKLLDFPDFKQYRNQVLASSDLVDKMIDSILDQGKYLSPEPEMDLAKARSVGQQRYLEAKLDGAAPARLSLLSRWLEAVKGMIPVNPVEVAPMAPAAPSAGMATPEPTPTSPLVPFSGPIQ
jgi:hypothetical protein